jgi:hypothetical protein
MNGSLRSEDPLTALYFEEKHAELARSILRKGLITDLPIEILHDQGDGFMLMFCGAASALASVVRYMTSDHFPIGLFLFGVCWITFAARLLRRRVEFRTNEIVVVGIFGRWTAKYEEVTRVEWMVAGRFRFMIRAVTVRLATGRSFHLKIADPLGKALQHTAQKVASGGGDTSRWLQLPLREDNSIKL